jgi:hypothetical protein
VSVGVLHGATYLTLLIDQYCLLGMCALMPLLEAVDTLHVFVQKENMFMSNFVAALKVTKE